MLSTSLGEESLDLVVRNGFCSGCGACAYAAGGRMELNEFGEYVPQHTSEKPTHPRISEGTLSSVCPFLHPELNEDVLAGRLYSNTCRYDSRIGYYSGIFAGHVVEGNYRHRGTSGGVGTWIAVELLNKRCIDGVIHVKPIAHETAEGPLFEFGISRSAHEIRAGAQSRYHVVEMSRVLNEVHSTPGRYLFIGLPCYCKAMRRLQRSDDTLRERVQYVVSLVCGHLKATHWTLALAWSRGIPPATLGAMQYRSKGSGISAAAYVFSAHSKEAGTAPVRENVNNVVGGKWNSCAMMLNACDYCDDVVGETADVSIGDAWLPRFSVDPRGTNLIIARNSPLRELLVAAANQQRLCLQPLTADDAARSQAGGLRHRREGLSYRLEKAHRRGEFVPKKRIAAGSIPISPKRERIYDARMAYAAASRTAFRQALDRNDYTVFANAMAPYEAAFKKTELANTMLRRIIFSVFSEAFLRRTLEAARAVRWRITRALRIAADVSPSGRKV